MATLRQSDRERNRIYEAIGQNGAEQPRNRLAVESFFSTGGPEDQK